METSWHGVFDMDPNDVIQVRAGDLQEFLRQQMMGVTNPGLTVATADERKDNLSELAQRLRDCKHREFNDGMDVEYAIEEAIGYNGGSIEDLFDRLADLVESSEATQPERDGETFCEIRWMRDDILEAVNRASGTSLTRDGGRAGEVEAIIDSVIGEVQKQLHDGSIEEGWGIIDSLMPEEAVERALELDPPSAPGKEAVRDWYENNYGVSELSARMNPDLTFEEALRAVPLGERFYDKLWVRDPGVRKTVFQELADRYGVSYIDVNDAWTNMRPVPGTGLLEPAYGPGIYDELNEQGAKSRPDTALVRDWYVRTYPDDELGERIAPTLTFADALRAVPNGGGFYDALGVGDSIMRERVFEELAARTGLDYDDIYEHWLGGTPWTASPDPAGRVSLSGMERDNRASADALDGHRGGPRRSHVRKRRPRASRTQSIRVNKVEYGGTLEQHPLTERKSDMPSTDERAREALARMFPVDGSSATMSCPSMPQSLVSRLWSRKWQTRLPIIRHWTT